MAGKGRRNISHEGIGRDRRPNACATIATNWTPRRKSIGRDATNTFNSPRKPITTRDVTQPTLPRAPWRQRRREHELARPPSQSQSSVGAMGQCRSRHALATARLTRLDNFVGAETGGWFVEDRKARSQPEHTGDRHEAELAVLQQIGGAVTNGSFEGPYRRFRR